MYPHLMGLSLSASSLVCVCDFLIDNATPFWGFLYVPCFTVLSTFLEFTVIIIEGSDFKKLRRDKVRRLSFVDRDCNNTLDSEMPCVRSDDEEDEYHSCATKSKRIKLPRKVTFYYSD